MTLEALQNAELSMDPSTVTKTASSVACSEDEGEEPEPDAEQGANKELGQHEEQSDRTGATWSRVDEALRDFEKSTERLLRWVKHGPSEGKPRPLDLSSDAKSRFTNDQEKAEGNPSRVSEDWKSLTAEDHAASATESPADEESQEAPRTSSKRHWQEDSFIVAKRTCLMTPNKVDAARQAATRIKATNSEEDKENHDEAFIGESISEPGGAEGDSDTDEAGSEGIEGNELEDAGREPVEAKIAYHVDLQSLRGIVEEYKRQARIVQSDQLITERSDQEHPSTDTIGNTSEAVPSSKEIDALFSQVSTMASPERTEIRKQFDHAKEDIECSLRRWEEAYQDSMTSRDPKTRKRGPPKEAQAN